MVTVAIPGGTGGIGRTVVDAIRNAGKHKVIVLSRKAPTNQDPTAPIFAVDYTDVASLTKTFEDYNVEVVISTLFMNDETSLQNETNLVKAAEASKVTKRFVISNWGVAVPPEDIRLHQQAVRIQVIEEIRKTNLEWTQFYNGFFLDYYGMPYIESYQVRVTFVIDLEGKKAVIPGTGNEPVSFTYTKDLGKFVAAILDLPKWEQEFSVYSETTTWNEFLKKAEEVRGAKFDVTHDSIEKLKKGECTPMGRYTSKDYMPESAWNYLQAGFGVFCVEGVFLVKEEDALNKRFPEIKTTSIDEVLSFWKGK